MLNREELPPEFVERIKGFYCKVNGLKHGTDEDPDFESVEFKNFMEGYLVAHSEIIHLTQLNQKLSQGFISTMADLREYATWITRSYIGGSIVNVVQYNQAQEMIKNIDDVAKLKGLNLDKSSIKNSNLTL